MKSFLFIVVIFLYSLLCRAQEEYSYWIGFSDKNSCGYQLSNPEKFLSQRSIERRKRQNIKIDSTDLPVSKIYVDSVLNCGDNISFCYSSRYLNGITIKIEANEVADVLSRINKIKFIKYIECTYDPLKVKRKILKLHRPINYRVLDSNFGYGNSYNQIKMHNGEWLHQLGYCGDGMEIAVIDGGFLNVDKIYAYERAWGNGRILGEKDFTGSALGDFFLTNRHGCQVFSLLAAYDYGRFVGTAPDASYWLIKTEVPESEMPVEMDNLVAGIEYADSVGADVVTASLGYSCFADTAMCMDKSKMNGHYYRASIAESLAARKGMIIVNSVGNKGNTNWIKSTVPSDAEGIISVGSVDASGDRCAFSGIGLTADGRFSPVVCSLGQKVAILNEDGNPSIASGTSLSTPIIAGLATCLWQALPNLSSKDIVELIKSNSSHSLSPNKEIGYGVPDFYSAYIKGSKDKRVNEEKSIEVICKDNNMQIKGISNAYLNSHKFIFLLFNSNGDCVWRNKSKILDNIFSIEELENGSYTLFIKSDDEVIFICRVYIR